MEAFKFYRLNDPKSLMFPGLIETLNHLASVTSVLFLWDQQRAPCHC